MGRIQAKLSQYSDAVAIAVSLSLILVAGDAAAAKTIGEVATTITGSFAKLTQLITATAYIAGMGFAVGAIMKFKSHKDNPAQEPIGKPVGLLMVAAALLFLPTILGVTGKTVFGITGSTSTVTGVTF